MSVEFSNAYQEILLDNLMSIIKQNFVFQTQLKLVEDVGKQKSELEAKYNELIANVSSMQTKLNEAEKATSIAKSNSSAHEEKQRVQSALNEEMKKNSKLTKEIEEKNIEISNLKEYILKLEENISVSKLKKLNPEKASDILEKKEPAPVDLFVLKANDGSSF